MARIQRTVVSEMRNALRSTSTTALIGSAGMGKSSVLNRASEGLDFAFAQCIEALAAMSFRPLAQLVGSPPSGSIDDVTHQVLAALGRRPLVVEDVHWSDAATMDVLRRLSGRLPVVMTSRTRDPVDDFDDVVTIELGPLTRSESTHLAEVLHPELGTAERISLIEAAGGNPLLVANLARDGSVSSTFRAAVAERLGTLDSRSVDELRRLAARSGAVDDLSADRVERLLRSPLVERDELGRIWFVHDLFASAVIEDAGGDVMDSIRAEIASECPPAEAARLLRLIGRPADAAAAAVRGARDAAPVERADLLCLAVDALGDEATDELRLEAVEALLPAHRPHDALRYLERLVGDESATVVRAELYRARALWLAGHAEEALSVVERALDQPGADDVGRTRLQVEKSFIIVRLRVGDPSVIAVADAALELARRHDVDVPRALNSAGLARSHNSRAGWRELFESAAEIAAATGNTEERLGAQYWLASAYSFYGPLDRVMEIAEPVVEETKASGERNWYHHFFNVFFISAVALGKVTAARLREGEQILHDVPTFRNQAGLAHFVALAHLDAGRIDEAEAWISQSRRIATSSEALALLACAACDIALARRDVDGMGTALEDLSSCGTGFFGMNALAESAAINLSLTHLHDLEIPPSSTTLTPVLDAVECEREALMHARSDRLQDAIHACDRAAQQWALRGLGRFERRARIAPIELAVTFGEIDLARRLIADHSPGPVDVSHRRVHELGRKIERRQAVALLTDRQVDTLRLVATGLTTEEIAARLGVRSSTVDSHVAEAMRRLGARTRTQAASLIGD